MSNQQETNQNPQKTRAEMEATLVAKAWQDENFREKLLNNPKAILSSEFGKEFSKSAKIQVLEESNDTYYLIIPKKPVVSEELSEEALESVAGGGHFLTEGVLVGW